MAYQLISPVVSFALTTGPSQPEVQSFEPVGTTDMVDLFTGDFVYNIPLLDVEGYPINISYHSGGDMEQEASWVGLGWNINPGAVNRTVRGMPDDFNGEQIAKTLNIKNERNIRVGLGAGAELLGLGDPIFNFSVDASTNVNVSNYRGVSVDFGVGAGVNVIGMASAGINLGVSSQGGADIDYNLGFTFRTSQIVSSDVGASLGINYGSGYNTRSGLKSKNWSFTTGVSIAGRNIDGPSFGTRVPIGVQNYLPVITNSSKLSVLRGQIKLGGEFFGVYGHVLVNGMISNMKYDANGSKNGYGYLYADRATENDIQDFTRDKDGMFNETMKFLAPGNMTYDIYSVSGQGTGGSFRPFRNDFGSVYDPRISNEGSEFSMELEAGLGNAIELGSNFTVSSTTTKAGPWDDYKRKFKGKETGSLYEDTYFKQAGEATIVDPAYLATMGGTAPIKGTQTAGLPETKPATKRDARGVLVYYFTADEASKAGVGTSQKIYSYKSTDGFASGPVPARDSFNRVGGRRKAHQISEVMQVQTDGRRYVYGIPAMNNSQTEMTFAVAATPSASGIITYASGDNTAGNNKGRDNFFSATTTPAFAHSYLLTSVLSTDYVDVTGNGVTDDDFGSYTKFNYTLKDTSYDWKAPYGTNTAQYNPGFKTDAKDDKASYLSGSREQWMLHSIETKNYVAEFYTSARTDAKGINTTTDNSFKLDSIRLYNKHDRFINMTAAVPIKTVIFNYDYSLCKGVPNSTGAAGANGKLTLRKIYVRYGNSQKSMISPYQFDYGYNPDYNVGNKDRWGGYKPNEALTNMDFPFVKQTDASLDDYASAWSLQKITLPSGGTIEVNYEMDDYAFVQDKVAMEMFMVKGFGNSKNYSSGSQLYFDKNSPNLYYYFQRRKTAEKAGMSVRDNYFKGQDIMYYNIETKLADGTAFEPIKGYAEVVDVGYCNNDPNSDYGYVQVKPIEPEGGGASINPSTYMAINFGRYYLPHIIFPGARDDLSGIQNVLAGIKYAFGELVSIAKNPVKRMVEESKAKQVNLAGSFIRLNSPGLKKKGGGLRVKQLTFYDNWTKQAGGNAQNATYGKNYDYTTEDVGSYGTISSGVASYEPQIGGDENPFRLPVDYVAQSGGKFPPHDPVGLYQEMPVGETLYPSPVVGYSKVTVTSIHRSEGRSSQGQDISEFYTARDFPFKVEFTPLDVLENKKHYSFFNQETSYKATQGYSLIFNDMHGKPKRSEHRVLKPGTDASELISYKEYRYFAEGNKLDNNVPVIAHDSDTKQMKLTNQTVGLEADLTIDTREKKEETESSTLYLNFNLFFAGVFPVPVPLGYPYGNNYKNGFNSVVATKVIQQYGILKEVQSFEEGALTLVRNEAFDPVTGQAVITSVNNEYDDKEYTINYPAYWGYQSMGPAYANTGYEEKFASLAVSDYTAIIPDASMGKYNIGDELYITYKQGSITKENNVWVTSVYVLDPGSSGGSGPTRYCKCVSTAPSGSPAPDTVLIDMDTVNMVFGCEEDYGGHSDCGNLSFAIKPRYKYSFPASGSITNVTVKVVRSGAKNQLNESIQSYTALEAPYTSSGYLKDDLKKLISISAREFSDTLTAILPRYSKDVNPAYWDSLNVYVNGTRQIKRLHKEYAYLTRRDYTGSTVRSAGIFSAPLFWKNGYFSDECNYSYRYCYWGTAGREKVYKYYAATPPEYTFDFKYLTPSTDPAWKNVRTITKYSPWGQEIENRDAIGVYTTALYGYNNVLPVALAQNARQQEIFAEGFEDYQLLQVMNSFAVMNFSPFGGLFSIAAIGTSGYGKYNLAGTSFTISSSEAHSGLYSLATNATANLSLKVAANPLATTTPQAKFLPFTLQNGRKYIVSYWFRPKSPAADPSAYTAPSGVTVKSNIIDGWQQAEGILTIPGSGTTYTLGLPVNAYVDDIRIYPVDGNMKAFVYHPVTQKLVATLDENNFASFYEYDQEGNLVRTKKETEKGIATITESRSANPQK